MPTPPSARSRLAAGPRLAALALFAVLVVLASGCASEQERFERHLARAEEYAAKGERLEALIELRSALKLRPKDANVNFRIANELLQGKRYMDALFFFNEAWRLDPTRVEAALGAAKLLLHDDTDRAAGLIEEALQRDPENPRAHVQRAEVELVRGNTPQALTAALTATQVAPNDGYGFHQLGIVHLARVREKQLRGEEPPEHLWRAAIKAFERADQLYGGSVPSRLELGRLYLAWPEHKNEAVVQLQRAVEAAQEKNDTRLILNTADYVAQLAAEAQEQELQRWALERLIEADETSLSAWQQLALSEDAAGRSGEDVMRQLVARRPEDAQAHALFAQFLSDKQRGGEAVEHLNSVVDKVDSPETLLGVLVQVHTASRQREEAKQVIERLEREHPDAPVTVISRAEFALGEGQNEVAAETLRRLTAESPDLAGAQALLGVAELRLQNLEAALAATERSLQNTRNGALAPSRQRLKAQIQLESRDWTGLVRTLRQHQSNGFPLDVREQLMLTRALYETDQASQARRVLNRLLTTLQPPPTGAVVEFAQWESQRDPVRSYQLVSHALEREPGNAALLRAAAALDLAANRPGLALERVSRVIDAGNAGAPSYQLRAQVFAALNRFDEAEIDALRAFEAAPNQPGVVDLVASIYAEQGRLEEAIASFEEANRAGVLGAQPRVLLGRLYVRANRIPQAREVYEAVLAERSDLPGAKNDLAYLLADAGEDLERAHVLAQEAHQAMGDDPSVVDTLGYVYLRKGLHQGALDQFRRAVQLADGAGMREPALHYHLGLALRVLGRDREAIDAFERALSFDRPFAERDQLRRELDAARVAARGAEGSS